MPHTVMIRAIPSPVQATSSDALLAALATIPGLHRLKIPLTPRMTGDGLARLGAIAGLLELYLG